MRKMLVGVLLAAVIAGGAWLGLLGGARVATGWYHAGYVAVAWPAQYIEYAMTARDSAAPQGWEAWTAPQSRRRAATLGRSPRRPRSTADGIDARWRRLHDRSAASEQLRAWTLGEVGGSLLVVLGLALWVALGARDRLRPGDTGGTAAWATKRDLKWWRVRRNEALFIVGTAYGQLVAIPETQQYQHILIVAPPGSGKTDNIILPNLLAERGRRNLLILSAKPDVIEKTYLAVSRRHRALILDFTSRATSCGYNPLVYAKSYKDAQRFAQIWIEARGKSKEEYFNNAAELLYTAAILHLHASLPRGEEATLVHLHRFLLQGAPAVIAALQSSPDAAAREDATAFLGYVSMNPRLTGSVFSDFPLSFSIVRDPEVAAVLSRDETDIDGWEDLDRPPTAVYLVMDAEGAERLKPLYAAFLTQTLDRLLRLTRTTRGGRLPRPLFGYMDEIGNVPALPNFINRMATVRSALIGFVLVLQDRAQFEILYEEAGGNVIESAAATKIGLASMTNKDAEWMSKLLGVQTVLTKNAGDSQTRGGHASKQASRGESEHSRPLLYADEVNRLHEREMIVKFGNKKPLLVRQRWYRDVRELRKLSELRLPGGGEMSPLGPPRDEPLEAPVVTFAPAAPAPAGLSPREEEREEEREEPVATAAGGAATGTTPATPATSAPRTLRIVAAPAPPASRVGGGDGRTPWDD